MTAATPAHPAACSVVELRRYTLHAGTRETLIELFDREFVETQEAVGAAVLGQFRDLDDPDAFVWLRGFRDMAARQEALSAFYGGPVWHEHRDAANAAMIDSDDVLLLRPVLPLAWSPSGRRAVSSTAVPREEIVLAVYHLAPGTSAALVGELQSAATPPATTLLLVSEHSENTFTALPVREGEEVCVVVSAGTGDARELPGGLHGRSVLRSESFRLQLTARSLVPGRQVWHVGA